MKDISKANEKVTITLELTYAQADLLHAAISHFSTKWLLDACRSVDSGEDNETYDANMRLHKKCRTIQKLLEEQLEQGEVVSIEN